MLTDKEDTEVGKEALSFLKNLDLSEMAKLKEQISHRRKREKEDRLRRGQPVLEGD